MSVNEVEAARFGGNQTKVHVIKIINSAFGKCLFYRYPTVWISVVSE